MPIAKHSNSSTRWADSASLVAERRGEKLTMPIGPYTSGEVWNREEALGLVDANGTLVSYSGSKPGLDVVNYGPFKQKSMMATLAGEVTTGTEQGLSALGGADAQYGERWPWAAS